MQTVNVKDIKVKDGITESGTRAGQKWELVIIIGDDGSEFTTFDPNAKEVGIGGVIELEPVIKAGKTNFTKFNIIKKGQSPAPAATSSNGGGDSPEKRKSIEDQTRAERITELWIADKIPDDDSLIKKLRDWLNKLGASSEPLSEPTESTTGASKTEPKKHSNGIELVNSALKTGWKMEEIKVKLGITKPEDIVDLDEAARVLEL